MSRPSSGNKAIALMTGFFGIGQIIGPIGAGIVLEVAHSYSLSLLLATLVLVAAAIILLFGAVISSQKATMGNLNHACIHPDQELS
ncbi:YbfB/YjiJ family MFS transporter [Paenibacillus macerans]|nr:YbfB/YjiJ family MFS transporter [Paenibacillus macerans]